MPHHSQVKYAWKKKTIGVLNQDPPVADTFYPILFDAVETIEDSEISILSIRHIHTEAGVKTLAVQITIDGITYTGSVAADDSTWYYAESDADAETLTFGTTKVNLNMKGQSIKIEVKQTTALGTATQLDGRAQREQLEAT